MGSLIIYFRGFCSTTSTLSAGSTGSQARLIQSSHPPEKFQPLQLEELGIHYIRFSLHFVFSNIIEKLTFYHILGSPIWKPREVESTSSSLSRKTRGDLSSSRKSLTGTGYGGDAQEQQQTVWQVSFILNYPLLTCHKRTIINVFYTCVFHLVNLTKLS